MEDIIVGSDYSGVGAFDQSLNRLGIPYKKVFACDFDYYARLTYILNFGNDQDLIMAQSKEHKMFCSGMEFVILGKSESKDISEFEKKCKKLFIDGTDLETKKYNFSTAADQYAANFSFYYPFNVYDRQIPEEPLDIFMTSPPCQAFSLAGKRLGKADIKGILFFNSLDFIEKNKPKTFIFENVKGLLSDDKTNKKALYGNTFQEWINYLGGKSVNGNPTFFPYEDSVPYHIYFKVLNAKEYGIPQNRERIFIIGIRDDSENSFDFPKTIPLVKRLKDVLESFVDEKYFLSDEMVSKLITENGKEFINQDTQASQVHDSEEPFPTLCAGTHGYALGYIKDEVRPVQIGKSKQFQETSNIIGNIDQEAYTVRCTQPNGVLINELILLNRKKYNDYSESEISSTIIAGGTAGGSNLPLVVVENYKIGAIRGRNPEKPTSQKTGLETVQMLEINENGVSNALTTVQKDNVVVINTNTLKGFEYAEEEEEDSINFSNPNSKTIRGRVGKGVSQTLDTSCNQGVLTKQRIRRLTPTECFNLMDFNPEMIEKTISSGLISDSQLYKQAGNSICVGVLVLLIRKLLKL